MVRWHLAMIFGHLREVSGSVEQVLPVLLAMLKDSSPLVRSWAVTSLCLIARTAGSARRAIAKSVAPLVDDPSAAVSKRAWTALALIADSGRGLPASWTKRPR
jgi:hypothetical protein